MEDVTLMNLSCVTQCKLPNAFKCVETLKLENVGGMKELPELKKWEKKVTIACRNDWEGLDVNLVVEIAVSNKCCKKEEIKVFDMNRFVNLRELKVGDECFMNTEEVKLIGLHALERVVIGKNSFTKHKNMCGNDPNRHFYLKDCERLKELKMGHHAFSDFSVCEIANVPSLEVIEMGKLNEKSYNFCWASLELKSDDDDMK